MLNIRMEKDIILYYGNPAGYVSGGKAVVDPLFESEELKAFLSGYYVNKKYNLNGNESSLSRFP